MHTFSTLTFLFALSAAAPHALNHFRLHERAHHLHAPALKKHLAARDTETANLVGRQNISPLGHCGSGSGFVCAEGMCCSQYGYCGTGPMYCGGGNDSAPSGSVASGSAAAPAPYRTGAPSGAPSGAPAAAPSGAPSAAPSGAPPTAPSGSVAPSGSAAPSASAAPSGSAPSGAPAPSSSASPSSGGGLGNVYKFYTGNGSPSAGWPSESDWMDFESLWSANLPLIDESCGDNGWGTNNSPTESDDVKSAIQSIGTSSGIDPRVILAIMMQESKGCVRVITTDNGVVNPGLMQSHDGASSCNKNGVVSDPCPASEITGMIAQGTTGTPSGDGIKQTLSSCTAEDVAQKYYQAATIYNSGSLPENLDDNTATACYASDVANRLTGWTTAETKCTLS